MPKQAKQPDFAKLVKELEDIVAWFESGEADIDTSLAKFERGMELAQTLKKHLAEVENKVTKIQANFEKDS